MIENVILPLRIFSVDPATGKSGWALLELISLAPLTIKVLETGQIDGDKLFRQKKEMAKTFQRQFCVLDALYDEYHRLVTLFKPDVVVSESAFGYTHMSALISLTLAIHQLRSVTHSVLGKDLITVPPTISKKSFTGSGAADKDAMRKAYYTVPFLIRPEDHEDPSEHAIDAVSHGCGYIRRDIVGDIIQISAADVKRKKREKAKQKEIK